MKYDEHSHYAYTLYTIVARSYNRRFIECENQLALPLHRNAHTKPEHLGGRLIGELSSWPWHTRPERDRNDIHDTELDSNDEVYLLAILLPHIYAELSDVGFAVWRR